MLMKNDKKGLALIIASGKKPMEEAPKSEMGGEDDSSMGLESAAEEMMQAIHSKDTKGLVQAMKSFMDMCEQSEPEESQEEQPEPPKY